VAVSIASSLCLVYDYLTNRHERVNTAPTKIAPPKLPTKNTYGDSAKVSFGITIAMLFKKDHKYLCDATDDEQDSYGF